MNINTGLIRNNMYAVCITMSVKITIRKIVPQKYSARTRDELTRPCLNNDFYFIL